MGENLAYMIYNNEICEFYDNRQVLRPVDVSYEKLLPKEGTYVQVFELSDHIRFRGSYQSPSWSLDAWKCPITYRVIGYKEGRSCFRSATNTLILQYKGVFREIPLIDIFSGFNKLEEVSDGTGYQSISN